MWSESRWPLPSRRVLDPVERTCEILFGVIVVMTFTGSISVAGSGQAERRTVLIGAMACNLAWGIVDAAMYLLANFAERARSLAVVRAVRAATETETAHRLILNALPLTLSSAFTSVELETLRRRLDHQADPSIRAALTWTDLTGAAGVWLLVSLSTLPVVFPFFVLHDVSAAMRVSNAIALGMLFVTGWSLGNYMGRPGWRAGVGTMLVGVVLVAITAALGG